MARPTVQQLPISQDLRKGDEVDSLSGIPNRACLPHRRGGSKLGSRDRLSIAKTAADAASARCH
jgi:hypothetical protein